MIVCLILAIISIIVSIIIGIKMSMDGWDMFEKILDIVLCVVIGGFIAFVLIVPFVALDKSSGSTVGKITSVDKNFFGTTAIYIKVNETKEEEYCAEDEEIIELAKEYIGKYVKISYGTRVGLYHLNQCRQAPVEKIEIQNENNT